MPGRCGGGPAGAEGVGLLLGFGANAAVSALIFRTPMPTVELYCPAHTYVGLDCSCVKGQAFAKIGGDSKQHVVVDG